MSCAKKVYEALKLKNITEEELEAFASEIREELLKAQLDIKNNKLSAKDMADKLAPKIVASSAEKLSLTMKRNELIERVVPDKEVPNRSKIAREEALGTAEKGWVNNKNLTSAESIYDTNYVILKRTFSDSLEDANLLSNIMDEDIQSKVYARLSHGEVLPKDHINFKEVEGISGIIKRVLDTGASMYKNAGVLIDKIDNYIPRRWDASKVPLADFVSSAIKTLDLNGMNPNLAKTLPYAAKDIKEGMPLETLVKKHAVFEYLESLYRTLGGEDTLTPNTRIDATEYLNPYDILEGVNPEEVKIASANKKRITTEKTLKFKDGASEWEFVQLVGKYKTITDIVNAHSRAVARDSAFMEVYSPKIKDGINAVYQAAKTTMNPQEASDFQTRFKSALNIVSGFHSYSDPHWSYKTYSKLNYLVNQAMLSNSYLSQVLDVTSIGTVLDRVNETNVLSPVNYAKGLGSWVKNAATDWATHPDSNVQKMAPFFAEKIRNNTIEALQTTNKQMIFTLLDETESFSSNKMPYTAGALKKAIRAVSIGPAEYLNNVTKRAASEVFIKTLVDMPPDAGLMNHLRKCGLSPDDVAKFVESYKANDGEFIKMHDQMGEGSSLIFHRVIRAMTDLADEAQMSAGSRRKHNILLLGAMTDKPNGIMSHDLLLAAKQSVTQYKQIIIHIMDTVYNSSMRGKSPLTSMALVGKAGAFSLSVSALVQYLKGEIYNKDAMEYGGDYAELLQNSEKERAKFGVQTLNNTLFLGLFGDILLSPDGVNFDWEKALKSLAGPTAKEVGNILQTANHGISYGFNSMMDPDKAYKSAEKLSKSLGESIVNIVPMQNSGVLNYAAGVLFDEVRQSNKALNKLAKEKIEQSTYNTLVP